MMQDRTDLVRVINRNDTVVGRYGGVDYHFKKNEPVDVPIVVAQHVFCFGQKDKTVALARLGWARTSEELSDGLSKLDNVVFDEPPELIEAPKSKQRGRPKMIHAVPAHQTGSAGPPVSSGGAEGGSVTTEPPETSAGDGDPEDETF